ncbi:hypothetical protein NHX12_001469 [Muraenolepis orangiensis]|uniref:Reverse transcriptase domain-containing protein n=1 Tax=Muraenolepis orangiensis TaxID=630683 RepID=A0A9Q0IGM0_9TELE|nr:hypothetical protein NHX12_001469 [Muraenolepis orangiensis]
MRVSSGAITSSWHKVEIGIITGCTISVTLFSLAMNMLTKSAEPECRGPRTNSGQRQPPIRAFMDDLTVMTESVPGCRWILKGLEELVEWARMRFKPAKSRSMVLRKGKVVDKFRFNIADTAIPSISEKPVKSLGKVFDCSLRDTTSIQSTCTELDGWLKSVDKSGLPGKFKAWVYQHGILPRILWPLLVYAVPISTVETLERREFYVLDSGQRDGGTRGSLSLHLTILIKRGSCLFYHGPWVPSQARCRGSSSHPPHRTTPPIMPLDYRRVHLGLQPDHGRDRGWGDDPPAPHHPGWGDDPPAPHQPGWDDDPHAHLGWDDDQLHGGQTDMCYMVSCSASCVDLCNNTSQTNCSSACCNTTDCLNATFSAMMMNVTTPVSLFPWQLRKETINSKVQWTAGCTTNCSSQTWCTASTTTCHQECCLSAKTSCLVLNGTLNVPASSSAARGPGFRLDLIVLCSICLLVVSSLYL